MKRKKKKSKKHKREREENGEDEGAARAASMATQLANRAVAEESEEETDPSVSSLTEHCIRTVLQSSLIILGFASESLTYDSSLLLIPVGVNDRSGEAIPQSPRS